MPKLWFCSRCNNEEDLYIIIYQKDKFGNKITTEGLELEVKIGGNSLDNAFSNEEFIEFKEKTGFFKGINEPKELII